MTPIDDETLMAYADDVLPQAERQRVEQALAADAGLRTRLEAFRATARLLAPLDGTLDEPLPPRLQRLAGARPAEAAPRASPASAPARAPHAAPSPLGALVDWLFGSGRGLATAAAAFVIGGLVGLVDPAGWRADQGPSAAGAPPAASQAQLARALDATPAGVPVGIGEGPGRRTITPQGSVRTPAGEYCREYLSVPESEGSAPERGIACTLPEGGWQVRLLVAQPAPRPGEFRPASSGLAAFDALAAQVAQGEPLSPDEERRAIERSWRE